MMGNLRVDSRALLQARRKGEVSNALTAVLKLPNKRMMCSKAQVSKCLVVKEPSTDAMECFDAELK